MTKTYYQDAQGNTWVLIDNNGNQMLVKATAMDAIIITKNRDIKFRLNVLKSVTQKHEMPNVVAMVFTTANDNKYVNATIGSKTICFVMDSKQNVLKAVNHKEFADTYEKCQLASTKPMDVSLAAIINAMFKRKEHMAAVEAA